MDQINANILEKSILVLTISFIILKNLPTFNTSKSKLEVTAIS